MSDDYKAKLRAGSDPLVFFKREDELESGGIARGHIMAAAISHALRDGETLFIGANPLIPFAGARLAQLTHAPNLAMIAGASGGVNPLLDPLAPSSGDYANLVAEAVLPFHEVLMMFMGGHGDVFFAGGLQIDQHGNCNLATVGRHDNPMLRGPGSAGIPWACRARRTILYTTAHTRRIFVSKADFVSLAGWPEVSIAGSVSVAPELVITPLAVLDFTKDGLMRLVSVHAGVTPEEVADNTAFELVMPTGEVPTTAQPTIQEMLHMRTFDLDGLLSIIIPE